MVRQAIAQWPDYPAIARQVHRRFGLPRTVSVAVCDSLGLWHFFPKKTPGTRLVGMRRIAKLPRIALSRGAVIELQPVEKELLLAQLHVADLQCRLRRWELRFRAEFRHQQKHSSRLLRRSRQHAEKSIALFSRSAHDLKTPLSMLAIPLEKLAIEGDGLPVALRLQLEKIRTALYSVLRAVTHSLDAAQLFLAKNSPILQPHDLGNFISHVVEVYAIAFESYGIALKTEFEKGIICEIDPVDFEKILNNLLSNALKYNLPGSTVSLRLKSVGDNACLYIEDSSLSVPDLKQDAGGNPWSFSSHGIGLTVVRELVRRNRGRLSIHKIPNGMQLILTLPATPQLQKAARSVRPHGFALTMHEIELIAAEHNLLSRRPQVISG
ncbi:MAG: HAMP domain-containing histidine kinase [Turneriella sp.]|nr:HAMP domain-containing histidine kinase [Leptospiraceae bacterium]MCX7633420.1 HAMP domain-containing histidine kinase [Turneriella sp.]